MQPAMHGQAHKQVWPILSYYLMFIHYFGFSIEPDVRHCAHNTARQATAEHNNNIEPPMRYVAAAALRVRKFLAASDAAASAADVPRRCWPRFCKRLRCFVKFVAIVFTTFIALNHCIVLVDYVYQGSKVFMELMLEVRLVTTKFSALIFVLSWHYKQAHVRKLLRLVKATSRYILSAQIDGTRADDLIVVAHNDVERNYDYDVMAATMATARKKPQLDYAEQQQQQQRVKAAVDVRRARNALRAFNAAPAGSEDARNICTPDVHSASDDDDDDDYEDEQNAMVSPHNAHQFDVYILKWWLMCVCVTMLHFSLSELEITKSHHLWQWLDDYSMHQLNQSTTSESTLMFLASFDNYIYTVHVYGTRLIGASIICIVCSLQRDNIAHLTWHAQHLIKTSRALKYESYESSSSSSQADMFYEQTSRDSGRQRLFVLGRSDWMRTSSSLRRAHALGHLSECVHRAMRKCMKRKRVLSVGRRRNQVGPLTRATTSALPCQHRDGSAQQVIVETPTATRAATLTTAVGRPLAIQRMSGARSYAAHLRTRPPVSGHIDVCDDYESYDCVSDNNNNNNVGQQRYDKQRQRRLQQNDANARLTPQCWPTPSADCAQFVHANSASTARAGLIHATPTSSRSSLSPASPSTTTTSVSARSDTQRPSLEQPHLKMSAKHATAATSSPRAIIERQLEDLASKYELVRTVNAHIDACFGPMLLIQFSLLFLMSCIDVVYFSICFNPNTKTKYIIVSGMVLLWWPYLLLYKFASDIGQSSNALLVSVRRLARLAYLLSIDHIDRTQAQLHRESGHHDISGRLWTLSGRFGPNYPLDNGGAAATNDRAQTRASILNKLDHAFKPTFLTIAGVMTVDKFFLLNFAKIVVTASVMMIQFISN